MEGVAGAESGGVVCGGGDVDRWRGCCCFLDGEGREGQGEEGHLYGGAAVEVRQNSKRLLIMDVRWNRVVCHTMVARGNCFALLPVRDIK